MNARERMATSLWFACEFMRLYEGVLYRAQANVTLHRGVQWRDE